MTVDTSSLRPYMIRALHHWIEDNSLTPYIVVDATAEGLLAPLEYAQDDNLILNVSHQATADLKLGNEFLTFSARFNGNPFQIEVPISAILAVYARENGHGMVFTPETEDETGEETGTEQVNTHEGAPVKPVKSKAPFLKVIK